MGVDYSDPWEKTKRIWKNTVYNCKSLRQKLALTDKKGQDEEPWFLNCCEISMAQQKKIRKFRRNSAPRDKDRGHSVSLYWPIKKSSEGVKVLYEY